MQIEVVVRPMDLDTKGIAASFDVRALTYSGNEWHRTCAERLVSLCPITHGSVVLTQVREPALLHSRRQGS